MSNRIENTNVRMPVDFVSLLIWPASGGLVCFERFAAESEPQTLSLSLSPRIREELSSEKKNSSACHFVQLKMHNTLFALRRLERLASLAEGLYVASRRGTSRTVYAAVA